jgi:hypothetical protein
MSPLSPEEDILTDAVRSSRAPSEGFVVCALATG